MDTPTPTGPIPRTPVRPIGVPVLRNLGEELHTVAEEEESIPDTDVDEDEAEAPKYVPVAYITAHFKGKSMFSFQGPNKYKEGKLFLRRFAGEVKCSGVKFFKDALNDIGEAVFQTHNDTIFQALLQLCSDEAVDIVLRYPDDGVAAYAALYRAVYKTQTAVQNLGTLKAQIANWKIPGDRDPSNSMSQLQTRQREKSALVHYDMKEQVADIQLALPVEYAVPASHVNPATDPDTLISSVLAHYENYIRPHISKKKKDFVGGISDDTKSGQGRGRGGGGAGRVRDNRQQHDCATSQA